MNIASVHKPSVRALLMCLALSGLALPAAVSADDTVPFIGHWLAGTWDGTGHQSDSSSWSIQFTVTVHNDSYTYDIAYPSLNCGGNWTLQSSSDRQASFIEHITYGKDRCVDGGTITLNQVDRNTLGYQWQSGNDTASSQLKRKMSN